MLAALALCLALQESAHRTVILRTAKASTLLQQLQVWDIEASRVPREESGGFPSAWSQVTATADDENNTVPSMGPITLCRKQPLRWALSIGFPAR